MLRVMGRLGLVAWSVCAALAMGAVGVGWLFPGQQIIFTSEYAGSFERYITIADVEHQLNMPITFHQYGGFALSQRGELAFTAYDGNDGNDILSVDVYNHDWDWLTDGQINYTGTFHAVWSPDSSMLAFVAADESRYRLSEQIYISDGTAIRNLMPERSFRIIREIAWSPDGTQIAFTGFETNDSGSDIYLLTLSSGEISVLSPEEMNGTHPTWSPDGTRIAFASNFNGMTDIYVLNIGDNTLDNLTQSSVSERYPTWSPDGAQIAYVSAGVHHPAVFVMDSDGGNLRQLVELSGAINDINWSLDSTRLAVELQLPDQVTQIYVVGVDGSDVRRVSYKGYSGMSPAWLP